MRKSSIFALVFLVLGIALLIQAQNIHAIWEEPMGPKQYPQAVAILIIVTSAMNLGFEYKNSRKRSNVEVKREGEAPEDKKIDYRPILYIGTSGVFYVAGLTYVGFYSSTFLFSIATMGIISHFTNPEMFRKELLTRITPISLGIIAMLYGAVKFLHIYLP